MLLYIWAAVMVQAFVPGGGAIAALNASAFEAQLRGDGSRAQPQAHAQARSAAPTGRAR